MTTPGAAAGEAFERLAAAEAEFFAREFLAPALAKGAVSVRMAGVVCRMTIEPRDFTGWGVFRPVAPNKARFVRAARLAERKAYLALFPRVRLLAVEVAENKCLAVAAHEGDSRFRLEGAVNVHLAEGVQPFETLLCRFDGGHFWFEGLDPRRDPALAAYLRQCLRDLSPTEELSRSGLTAEERQAYAWACEQRLAALSESELAAANLVEKRLERALGHAGAELGDVLERGDVCQVRYRVDGREHVSIVNRNDLSVLSAGICLSGADGEFDLHSLVGVMREANLDST